MGEFPVLTGLLVYRIGRVTTLILDTNTFDMKLDPGPVYRWPQHKLYQNKNCAGWKAQGN